MKKIRKVFSVFLAVCFFISGAGVYALAEDISYLKAELAEHERKQAPIGTDILKMEIFINDYPGRVKSLEDVVEELTKVKEKLERIQRNNMIKSIISLGLDTLSFVTVVKGLYLKSVKVIILGLSIEGANYFIGQSYSSGAYARATEGVSDEARAALPEIEKLHFLLTLTQGEWRAYVRLLSGKEDVGENQVIYAQFNTLITEIDKNIERAKKIISELTKAKQEMESELPDMQKEWDSEQKTIVKLRNRLNDALDKERQEKVSQEINTALNAVPKTPPIIIAPIAITGKYDADYEAWKKKYDQVKTIIDTQMPSAYKEVVKGREEVSTGLADLVNEYRETVYISLDSRTRSTIRAPFPGKANPDAFYNLAQATFEYVGAKMSPAIIEKGISASNQVMTDLGALKEKAIDLTAQEAKFTQLLELAHSIEMERMQVQGRNSVDQERMIYRVLWAMIPNFVNFNKSSVGKGYLEQISTIESDLESSQELFREALDVCSYNENFFQKHISKIKNAYEQRIRNTSELLANLENADTQMKNELANYNKAVKSSGWSAKNGKLEVFNEKKFSEEFISSIHRGDFSQASAIANKYENMINTADKTYNPHSVAREHCYYYMDSLSADNLSFLGDIINAENVPESPVSIKVPSDVNPEVIKATISEIRRYCDEVKELPILGRDENSTANKAYELFLVWKRIQTEGKGWTDLSGKAFFAKWESAVNEVTVFSKNDDTKNAASAVMSDLIKIRDQWAEKHKDEIPSEPEPNDKEKDSENYYLMDAKLNKRSLEEAGGIVVITKDDLVGRGVEVSGKMNDVKGIKKLFISVDGAVSWEKIPVSTKVSYKFNPQPEKLYRPYLKIELADGAEERILFFSGINGIVLRDVDMTELVVAAVKNISDAYEARSVSKFSDIISKDFIGNRVFLTEGVRFDFDMFVDISLKIFINRIEKTESNTFAVDTRWDKTQVPRKTMQQQRTTGNTTMVFVLEEGKMKLKNLRGNLIYATLSPEIAESSGLSSSVVEAIREARDERNPVQPGAGETEEDGGLGSGGTAITSRNGTINHLQSFDFDDGRVTGGLAIDDISYVGGFLHWNAAGYIVAAGNYDDLDIAPAAGYVAAPRPAEAAGNKYYIRTGSNNYGKMEVTAANAGEMTFRYAVQPDGSTNIRTQ